MKGSVRVFNHPYYAVTNDKGEFEIKDAPAGEFRIVMYHPTANFINHDSEKEGGGVAGRFGTKITIKANGVTDLGKIKLKPKG
jgi:hypothetical protein